jgi:hypothetical protein
MTFALVIFIATLDPSGRVPCREPIDFLGAHPVEIPRHGLLQRARGHREPERVLRGAAGDQAVDEPAGKAVAPADPIDEPHVVALAALHRPGLGIPQRRAPAVVARRDALPQRDGHHRRTEVPRDAFGGLAEAVQIELAARDVGVRHVHAENGLQVLLVGDDDVHLAHHRAHGGLRLRFGPQFLAEIQIHADPRAGRASGRNRPSGGLGAIGPERRRDAGDVKPVRAVEDGLPVHRVGRHLADRGTRPIVEDRRGPLAGADFRVVDPDPAAAAHDAIGPYPLGAQRPDGRITNRVVRQRGDVHALEAELREADGDIGLAAAERRDQEWRLKEALESRRAQPEHDLAERHDLLHQPFPLAARTLATIRSAFARSTR